MALDTVQDYVAQARVLLQDTITGSYRYDDTSLVMALNDGLLEARRMRPDLFIGVTATTYTTVDTTAVTLDLGYRTGLVYYIAGWAQLRDDEINQDSRASTFMQQFKAQLMTLTT